jgi:hypothetical protein
MLKTTNFSFLVVLLEKIIISTTAIVFSELHLNILLNIRNVKSKLSSIIQNITVIETFYCFLGIKRIVIFLDALPTSCQLSVWTHQPGN